MEPLEREDSSTYVNRPQEQSQAPQPVQQVEPPRQKKSRTTGVLALLLLLAIIAAAALGWLWYQQSGRVDNLESDLSQARNNVTRLESSAKAEAAIDDSVTTDTDSTSSDAIIEAALAYAQAPSESKSVKYETKIVYNKDGFARVTVSSGAGSGFTELLKYVNDQWVVIVAGQNEPSSDDIKTYGIPQAVIDSYKV